ncbi:hypothetical protein [Vibrio sp. YIC-376]|uniref:hypothetical protein n=1 Tax=Vibrio sp. YIC-376 TaxID=3136162 RepID=UPI00402AD066
MKVGISREYSSSGQIEEDECIVMLDKAELVSGEIRISGSGERDPTSKHDGFALTGYVLLHPAEFQKVVDMALEAGLITIKVSDGK